MSDSASGRRPQVPGPAGKKDDAMGGVQPDEVDVMGGAQPEETDVMGGPQRPEDVMRPRRAS